MRSELFELIPLNWGYVEKDLLFFSELEIEKLIKKSLMLISRNK